MESLAIYRGVASSSPDLVNWTVVEPVVDEIQIENDLSVTVEYATGCKIKIPLHAIRANELLDQCTARARRLLKDGQLPPLPGWRDLEATAMSLGNRWAQDRARSLMMEILAWERQIIIQEKDEKIQQQQQLIEHLQARIVDAKEGRRL